MEIGNKIKQYRMKCNLTQESLADRLNISPQSISKWENGITMPDITLLPELSEIFGVTIDELFDLSVDQKLNRIESKLDIEDGLSNHDFKEIEAYLKEQATITKYKYKSTYLLSYLYFPSLGPYPILIIANSTPAFFAFFQSILLCHADTSIPILVLSFLYLDIYSLISVLLVELLDELDGLTTLSLISLLFLLP